MTKEIIKFSNKAYRDGWDGAVDDVVGDIGEAISHFLPLNLKIENCKSDKNFGRAKKDVVKDDK